MSDAAGGDDAARDRTPATKCRNSGRNQAEGVLDTLASGAILLPASSKRASLISCLSGAISACSKAGAGGVLLERSCLF
jgi:hypothetical protein